jgi:hypothetical protein
VCWSAGAVCDDPDEPLDHHGRVVELGAATAVVSVSGRSVSGVTAGPDAYGLVVLFLAYTGLRWGELATLRMRRIDFLRRQVLVAESVTPVRGYDVGRDQGARAPRGAATAVSDR